MSYPALLIDTSCRHLVFARLEQNGGGLLTVKTTPGQDEDTIDNAVAELFPGDTTFAEIWLGQGPGSFVGLRSSFAYVRMLSMLKATPCRTFLSSRLWRMFFGVAADAWFLTRTNQRLYYAERYTPEREAAAIEVKDAANLSGEKFCFSDSWVATAATPAKEMVEGPWQILNFAAAQISVDAIRCEALHLTDPVPHTELVPLYGHELNFALAKNTQ